MRISAALPPIPAQEGAGKHYAQNEYPKNGVAVAHEEDGRDRDDENDGQHNPGMGVRLSSEDGIKDGLR